MLRRGFPLVEVLAATVSLTLPHPLRAQVVRGRVLENETDRPLGAVAVALLGADNAVQARTQTTENGSYEIRAPGPGTYSLRFAIPGYQPFLTRTGALAADQVVEFSPKLSPLAAIGLDTVVVRGERVPRYLEDFYRRKSGRLGDFLTRADIDRWSPREPTDLVRRLSDFQLKYDAAGRPHVTARRAGFGSCPPNVFVDGVYVGNTETYDLDSFLWVTNIEGVEAYGGPARLPVEFNVPNPGGSGCGAMVFWTKR